MSMTDDEHLARLNKHTNDIIMSSEPRRLVVAGPGAGKTTLFENLLKESGRSPDRCLVFTFLGALKKDLEDSLSPYARIYTFHGYCHYLLRKYASLRDGVNADFVYFPGLGKLILTDWQIVFPKTEIPTFEKDLQLAKNTPATNFYIKRANYYDSVGYNDSIFRTLKTLTTTNVSLECDLILIDEFQDFNQVEATFVHLLEKQGTLIVAGDDDQALYEELRMASSTHIQDLYDDERYKNHFLPYCMRCTEAVVEVVKFFLEKAVNDKIIIKRIPKEFSYCPPVKRNDSEQYPKIKIARTSVQSKTANYFGKYILSKIREVPMEDIRQSKEKGYPTCLIIAPNPFRDQISTFLKENSDYKLVVRPQEDDPFDREKILQEIKREPASRLWWRAILQIDQPDFFFDVVNKSYTKETDFVKSIPEKYQQKILSEAKSLPEKQNDPEKKKEQTVNIDMPTIQISSFEGSKGLSAVHVFVAGLQNGIIPNNPKAIKPMEVKKMLVALTRTRKCCHLIYSTKISGRDYSPSEFLKWIPTKYREDKYIDKTVFDAL